MRSISSLDFKLGIRMLIKYPWLTAVGGLGIAVAVAIGAGAFGVIYTIMDSKVPLPDGDRIVSIQNWSDSTRSPQRRIAHDFFIWRDKITTMENVGLFHSSWRNLITPYGDPDPFPVAEITASGFRAARVAPITGRPLQDSDEQPGAPLVAVIGEEVWRERFAQDPDILKQNIQIGAATYRIVGVMPRNFGWPLHHEVWLPLRIQRGDFAPRKGPFLFAFGRLKPDVTYEEAQAELAQIGKLISASSPQTHAQIRPTVLPYTFPFVDLDSIRMSWAFHAVQMSFTILLVLVCANVAMLMYARTATRVGEILVRTALGASRTRIVGQLFTEALVLAAVASVVGIVLAKMALSQINISLKESLGPEVPFWMRPDISTGVIFYTVLVTLLAAAIVGALPAIKATGRSVQGQLRQLGGGSGLLLGRTWTILIVAQVAFAVTILPATINYAWESANHSLSGPSFEAENYLSAVLGREIPSTTEFDFYSSQESPEYVARQAELMQQLRAEPAVAAATFALSVPGEEGLALIEVEGLPLPPDSIDYSLNGGSRHGYPVRPNRVDTSFFNAFSVSTAYGRQFVASDQRADSVVIVNQKFVDQILKGQNAIGRRFRYVGRGGDADIVNVPLDRWFEIVGVVGNFPPNDVDPEAVRERVYHTPIPGRMYTSIFLKLTGDIEPMAFESRLKRMATSIDPTLQLSNILTLSAEMTSQHRLIRLMAIALITMTLSVLLLSAAGIYSLMSLAVNQRRREIGIRSALGAYPRNIMVAVFKRAARQLAVGVIVGVVAALLFDRLLRGNLMEGNGPVLLPIVALIMSVVGLLAALGPARRGLQIQPTEALRDL